MPSNAILSAMLERLFASVAKGPCVNCRPHASRQRIDLTLVDRLKDVAPHAVLVNLLGESRQASVAAKIPAPPDLKRAVFGRFVPPPIEEEGEQPAQVAKAKRAEEEDPKRQAYLLQRSLLSKLRNLSEDARIYEQDTGVHALHLGYPLLSLPPGMIGSSSRVLAPIAFVPISLAVRTGQKPGFDVASRGEGVDLVMPNMALLAWLERQTGKTADDLFADEEGAEPWEEIAALVKQVCGMLDLPIALPPTNATDQANPQNIQGDALDLQRLIDPAKLSLEPIPKSEELADKPTIYRGAVLGLFPMANQSLLRDTQSMIEEPALAGPVLSFVDSKARLDVPPDAHPEARAEPDPNAVKQSPRKFADERLVAPADPCQSRAVTVARAARGLVVHGPPGTGKSQTITNIIGDHLSRGQRILFVCDKRTALDVVADRLEHLGLGDLCAVVHDPQRDQRDLYLAIRNQLDALAEATTHPRAQRSLEKIDDELQRIHSELTQAYHALMSVPSASPDDHGRSFHELMGQWLSIGEDAAGLLNGADVPANLDELDAARNDIEVILRRGLSVKYPKNPWVHCVGTTLEQYLARSAADMRRSLASCIEDARAADAIRSDDIPPFDPQQPLQEQVQFRKDLAAKLRKVIDSIDPALAKRLSVLDSAVIQRQLQQLQEASPQLQILRDGPLDTELAPIARDGSAKLTAAAIAQNLADLDDYLYFTGRWHAFIHFVARSRATQVLRQFGLPLTIDAAQRLKRFLLGMRARMTLSDLHRQLAGDPSGPAATPPALVSDEMLSRDLSQHQAVLDVLGSTLSKEGLEAPIRAVLVDFKSALALLAGLDRSEARATALEHVETSLRNLNLFDANWLAGASAQMRAGRKAVESLQRLEEHFDSVEGVLRIRNDLGRVKESFRSGIEALLKNGAEPESGLSAMMRGALAGEIKRRLATDPALSQIDSERLAAAFDRCRSLEDDKRGLVRDAIIHQWRSKQKERLLVSTGSRLNAEGAKLRQRLFVRGSRAMRLRQVIALGQGQDSTAAAGADNSSGDPLFDLCPVWMASPESVAQIFPRRPVFDVVVFDEASQCKLEEALPVLTRAGRVVIAGDPKQLPPTRFFETSISESDDDALETDQDLFETQQGEIEDLLTAALNLEIEESYLDVHYRSRNADLIEFSNQQFYGERLQPIPGHPANRSRYAPITLQRVAGVYDRRCNPLEAKRVCEIVRDLLKRAAPPSIGVACFNLAQRDLIVEMLDDLAAEDADFSKRLAEARERKGEGSFEGLFVKNLENVQGDERDHMIISTTYGPDPKGKFYRRFGPLGMPGGGRRLNVLITRAKHEVHLVTSIPREAYANTAPVPAGQTPNGGWLLFAYLRFAETLAETYEAHHKAQTEAARAADAGEVNTQAIELFSKFALALGQQLANAQHWASDVHWGNEGFRIDVALHHPQRAEDVTVGVLCDFAQYRRAQDPVEWDLFRTAIHESQGWRLHRVWSPQYFRDAAKVMNSIERDVADFLAKDASQVRQKT